MDQTRAAAGYRTATESRNEKPVRVDDYTHMRDCWSVQRWLLVHRSSSMHPCITQSACTSTITHVSVIINCNTPPQPTTSLKFTNKQNYKTLGNACNLVLKYDCSQDISSNLVGYSDADFAGCSITLLHRYKGKIPRAQSSKTHKASTLTWL